MLPHWEVNPGPLTLLPYMLLSELIPLFAGSPLDSYVVMVCWFKDQKGWDFQQI